ncbi:MAG: hypothetical protein JRH20_05425, partial [Deltaproteobacteria bacterium]|nr:hypothetical protein [Deltaproteobacteria bacterium]
MAEIFTIDNVPTTVTDTLFITESPLGTKTTRWKVKELQDADGSLLVFADRCGEATLFRPLAPGTSAPRDIPWDYKANVWARSVAHGGRGPLVYSTGESAEERFLRIGSDYWQMDDHVACYGPHDHYLARTNTPAMETRPLKPLNLKAKSVRHARIGWGLIGVISVWSVVSMILGRSLGFAFAYAALGFGVMALNTFRRAPRSLMVFSASVGLFVLSSAFLEPLVASWVPAQSAIPVLALAWLVAMTLLSVIWQRGFYTVGDAATKASFFIVFGYIFATLLIDGHWLPHRWWSTFHDAPQCYIWLALFVGALIYYAIDYRKVPLSYVGFSRLRAELVERLANERALRHAKLMGDAADDLADAVHLSHDSRVRRY